MNSPRVLGFATSIVLHAGAIIAALWGVSRPAPAMVGSAASTPSPIVVPDARSVDVPEVTIAVPRGSGRSELRIGGFRFDYGKIAERSTMLFPFLTRPLPLERSAVSVRHGNAGSLRQRSAPAMRPRVSRPLILSDAALQQLVDKSWSRRERWPPFRRIAALVTAHGPDDERVVALLRAYRDQNVLQPYVTTSLDSLLWVMLGTAADHGDFIDFVGKYAARHPSSKVTTELLFLLDELAQGSSDALSLLLEIRGHDLWWTRESNREAYDLIVAIQQHYRAQLTKKGVRLEVLGAYYDNVRLSILAHIIRTTPDRYRIDDAWFLSGGIYWKQNRRTEALSAWRQMTSDPEAVYAAAAAEVRGALQGTTSQDGRDADAAAVNRIVSAEKSRWLASSARRLAHFGYSVDTF